ncbi:hypothetical protein [Acinetobacter sp. P1(2025)]|uniref:hypothetical protein n=1 Tax=Acinetobacter sp. P1(2025) TaxID=3446120 RepID=UPI003F52D334
MGEIKNPYTVLGIPNFSDYDVIEDAYQKQMAAFDNIVKISNKQSEKLTELMDAYDFLIDTFRKEELDNKLKEENNHQIMVNTQTPDIEEIYDAPQEEKVEPSKEKNIVLEKTNTGLRPFTMLILAVVTLFAVTYIYSTLFGDKPKEQVKVEQPKPVEAPKEPQQNPILEPNVNAMKDVVRYPSPTAFNDQQMIYDPNGNVFPTEATVISSLPYNGDGTHTIALNNPRDTAIFGRVVDQYSVGIPVAVLRHFYIPPNQTLYLFNIPAGKIQIQILTLNNPTAYVSPTFNLSLGGTETTNQVANWDYPIQASELF